MAEIKETAVNYCVGDKTISVFTDEQKYCNKIKQLKKQYPDEVIIKSINEDGSIMAYFPIKWFKFPKPPKKVSEDFKIAAAERMRKARSNKNN